MKHTPLKILVFIFVFMNTMVFAQYKTSSKEAAVATESLALDAFRNDIVVISIWNPDDPQEIEALNVLVKKYKGKNVRFLAITDGSSTTNYTDNLLYYHLTGVEAEKIFNTYQKSMFKNYPIHIILNQERKVVFKKQRIVKNIEKKIAKKLETLLDKEVDRKKVKNEDNYTMQ